MPRIAIDATPLSQRVTGAGRVIRNLLAVLPMVDPGSHYVALATPDGAMVVPDGVEVRIVRPGSGLNWELKGAAEATHEAEADLLFTIRELVGRRNPPTVLHLFEPPAYRLRPRLDKTALKDALLSALIRRSVRRAAAVTAGSATTAAWLHEHCGLDSTVVLPGLEDAFFASGLKAERSQPYLFHVAGSDPRDATEVVLATIALLGADSPQLLIAGLTESRRAAISRDLVDLGIAERVELLGWVDDDDLRALYRGALAVVHVARYEAYGGLPALEAMALGAPVIASRAPGVTEALEGAAELIEHPDPLLLAEAVQRLARDPELRADLVRTGGERVSSLRWERAATEFAAVFRRVLL